MPIDLEVRLLLNNLLKIHYDYFKVLEKVFDRYIVDQHKHYSEYPDEPPFYLISSIYELDRITIDYCVFGAARIVNAHDACADMIKYRFWLYYNTHYSDHIDDRIIKRFNKVAEKCITILKLNDEITKSHSQCNPMCTMFLNKN
jgi:hypothetical protein